MVILANFKANENTKNEVKKKLTNFIEKVADYQEDTENMLENSVNMTKRKIE